MEEDLSSTCDSGHSHDGAVIKTHEDASAVSVVVASARFATVLGNGNMYGCMAIVNCFNMHHDRGTFEQHGRTPHLTPLLSISAMRHRIPKLDGDVS